jgi:hypothetical protein
MNKTKIIKALHELLQEDESLKYALATNLAKYGRPQSKKSDKPSKLTKDLEKGREKYVKGLKKVGLNEIDDISTISPAEAFKLHKFITNRLRKAVMDYNESLSGNERQIRMSFFEQEFPLASSFYNEISGLKEELNESLRDNIEKIDFSYTNYGDLYKVKVIVNGKINTLHYKEASALLQYLGIDKELPKNFRQGPGSTEYMDSIMNQLKSLGIEATWDDDMDID